MDMITQANMSLLSTSIPKETNSASFNDAIDSVSNYSDVIQNLWWIVVALFTIFLLMYTIFSIVKRSNKFTRVQINYLIRNGKYIPKVFVELNESKEIFRYFIYGRKWKKRLIKYFNFIYDNAYGDILRKACDDVDICFHMNNTASLESIENTVKSAIRLHNRFKKGKIKFNSDYKETQYLFEVIYYPYKEALDILCQYSKSANAKYVVLTGSAGNGKTNLLCSISQLLINLQEGVILLNARDIEGDVLEFILNKLQLPKLYKEHKEIYLRLVNLFLTIRQKHLFIIIDAINENDNDGFGDRIADFCNKILSYGCIKVIVSCRNEYYKERFQEYLVDRINMPAFEYDLKEQHYTPEAVDRIIKAYSSHFNYTGNISPIVRNILSKQLLMLRIFFEVNQNSNTDVLSVMKHEIFEKYIETAKRSVGENLERLLDTIADAMLKSNNFDEITILELGNSGINSDIITKVLDSSILISKKLISHEGTIAKKETEVVYFVFDEMRDYYLARRVLLMNISKGNVDGEAIIAKIKNLKERGASCAEGIIHYIYIFFRTDKIVEQLKETEKLCNTVLDIYRTTTRGADDAYWNRNNREELKNLGLRIILTHGLPIADFEISYIQDCLRRDPSEDGGVLFDSLLEGTLYSGVNNLDTYLDIILGLQDRDEIYNAFRQIISRNSMGKHYIPDNFIKYHKKLVNEDQERALQIHRVAELFLYCFKLNDIKLQGKLVKYFYSLPTHDHVMSEIVSRMNWACGLEVRNDE